MNMGFTVCKYNPWREQHC